MHYCSRVKPSIRIQSFGIIYMNQGILINEIYKSETYQCEDKDERCNASIANGCGLLVISDILVA